MKKNLQSSPLIHQILRYGPLFITLLILATVILGYWGYAIHTQRKPSDPFSIVYETILMFKMESYESGVINWQLIVARYLATLIVGYGIFVLVVGHFRKWWQRMHVMLLYRKHTIIAGLGSKGFSLAMDLHEHGVKVVAMDNDENNPLIRSARRAGIMVIISDGLDRNSWIHAGLFKAGRIVLAMGSDDRNIETALFLAELCSAHKEGFHLEGLVNIDNPANFALLKDYLDGWQDKHKLNFNLFSTSRLAAQRIWDQHPPHDPQTMNPKGAEISILISGFNESAEAFLTENMILTHYRDQKNIGVFLQVDQPAELQAMIEWKYPFMDRYLEMIFTAHPETGTGEGKQMDQEETAKLNRVYVFGEEDAEVILRAKKLRQWLYCAGTDDYIGEGNSMSMDIEMAMKVPEIIVCLPEKSDVVGLLNASEKSLSDHFGIRFFRVFSDSLNKASLIDQNDLVTMHAKVINYLYAIKYVLCGKVQTLNSTYRTFQEDQQAELFSEQLVKTMIDAKVTGDHPLAMVEKAVTDKVRAIFPKASGEELEPFGIDYQWNLLTDLLEDSNYYSARHASIKMLYPHGNEYDFEALAPMEHKRWMAEKQMFGFRNGFLPLQPDQKPLKKILKEELRISDLMVPYPELPVKEQDKDYDPYRLLDLLQRISKEYKKASAKQTK